MFGKRDLSDNLLILEQKVQIPSVLHYERTKNGEFYSENALRRVMMDQFRKNSTSNFNFNYKIYFSDSNN